MFQASRWSNVILRAHQNLKILTSRILKTAAYLWEKPNQTNQRAKKMVTHQTYKFKKEFLKCLNISCHYKSAFRYFLIFFLSMKYLTPRSETFFHYRFFHMKTKQYTHTHTKSIYCVSVNIHWKRPQYAAGSVHLCPSGWSYPSALASKSATIQTDGSWLKW